MKKLLLILFVFFGHHAVAQNAQSDTSGKDSTPSARVLHIWETEDKDGKMQVYAIRDTFYGKMIYSRRLLETDGKTYKKDVHNPDTALRSRSLVDYNLIMGLTYKDGKWTGGKIYDSESGNYYDVNLEIKEGVLYMRAYKGTPMFGKTIKWNLIQ